MLIAAIAAQAIMVSTNVPPAPTWSCIALGTPSAIPIEAHAR